MTRNAYLLSVAGGATSEDYGHQSTDAPPKWSGRARVAVKEHRFREVGDGKLNQVVQDEMTVPMGLDIDFQPDDGVTYKLDREHAPTTRRVRDTEAIDRVRLTHVTFWDD